MDSVVASEAIDPGSTPGARTRRKKGVYTRVYTKGVYTKGVYTKVWGEGRDGVDGYGFG